jgi:hypothetical protein
VHEEIRVVLAARANLVGLEALKLPHRPSQKRQIDVSEKRVESRWRISSVVRYPAPKERIDLSGDVGHGQLCSMSDVQFPDRRPHGFQCRDADRWIEPLKVNCAMNVDALTPARLLDHELVLFWRPTADWPRRMGQMHGIGEQHGLVVAQGIHELFIACDESLLQFFVKLARDDVWLVIGQTQAMTAQSVPNGFRKPGRIAS